MKFNERIEEIINEEYVERIGDEFDEALKVIVRSWKRWKQGPMTEPGDIKPAKKEVLKYISKYLEKNF